MSDANKSKSSDDKSVELYPHQWAWKKILGPTFNTMGEDLEKVYSKGRDKIISVATRKAGQNAETDHKKANIRVAKDIIMNGAFNDEAIAAEYFGGILAQSRSVDGRDDRGVFYLGLINSLSAKQLLAHYLFYSRLNEMISENEAKKNKNPGSGSELHSWRLFIPSLELIKLGVELELDIPALYNKGLILNYQYSNESIEGVGEVHAVQLTPSTLGIQLYVVACGYLDEWRKFGVQVMNNFEVDEKLGIVGFNLSELLNDLKKSQ